MCGAEEVSGASFACWSSSTITNAVCTAQALQFAAMLVL